MTNRLCFKPWLLASLMLSGCTPAASDKAASATGTKAEAAASSQPAELDPVAPYPQYANWIQFAVGTRIVRRKEVTNPNGTVIETETLKLLEKSAAKLIVESQTLVERSTGVNDNNPPQTFEYPATFRVPKSVSIEQFQLPSLKAKLVGQEKCTVAGKEYLADVYEWTEVNEAGPMKVKLLSSETFPGKKLRQEMTTEQTQTRSIEEITEVDFPTT